MKLFLIWHLGVCLSYTSGAASPRQTSTPPNKINFVAKERLLAERNAALLPFVFFSLFFSVSEYSLLSRLK